MVLTLHARYVSTVSGPGADTDRIHCIWAEIQLVQYVLYLIVSEVEADTDCMEHGVCRAGVVRRRCIL